MNKRRYVDRVRMTEPVDPGSYLHGLPVVRYLEEQGEIRFDADVTIFMGENGTGKSTLIEAIAVASDFNPEGGTKNFDFSTNASHSDLWRHLQVGHGAYARDGFFLRAESFYNAASYLEDLQKTVNPRILNSYGGQSLHTLSHGESFLALVQHRFGGKGLYILDEPEAALSPTRLLTLMAEMDRLIKDDSQFIIATHSPILMAFPGAAVWEFSEDGIRLVDYRQTTHYQITHRFLEDPERILKMVLEG